jgi:hypothetical protein
MLKAAAPGAIVLDLQVIRPNPQIEVAGRVVSKVDAEPLFLWADAATAAVSARVAAGDLVDEATDDHDVLKHYTGGADLLEDLEGSLRRLPEVSIPTVAAIDQPFVVRERCRLRRLRVS